MAENEKEKTEGAPETKPEGKQKKGKVVDADLLAPACIAYGIDPQYVFASRQDSETEEVVILTNGGTRVRWSPGMKVEPLDPIAVTGINPIKRKPISGPKKKG